MNIQNRIEKNKKKKQDSVAATYLRKELQRRLTEPTKTFGKEAFYVLMELLEKVYPLQDMIVHANGDIKGVTCFMGKNHGVIVGDFDTAVQEMIITDIDELSKKQFTTFAEDRMYCEGTEELLGLLTRFRKLVIGNVTFMAIPEANVYSADKAIFLEEDREIYNSDDRRTVYISVIHDTGFIMFGFNEKVNHEVHYYP